MIWSAVLVARDGDFVVTPGMQFGQSYITPARLSTR